MCKKVELQILKLFQELICHDKEIFIATIPTFDDSTQQPWSRFYQQEASQEQIYPDVLRCRIETRRIQFGFYFLIWPSGWPPEPDQLWMYCSMISQYFYPSCLTSHKQPNKNSWWCCQTMLKLFYFLVFNFSYPISFESPVNDTSVGTEEVYVLNLYLQVIFGKTV